MAPSCTREVNAAPPLVDWLALDDDLWRTVATFLKGLEVYALRATCSPFRARVFPLSDVPAGTRLAHALAKVATRLDRYPAPEGVTPSNLLYHKYNVGANHAGIFPKRSNASQTLDALVEAPMGELCDALHTLMAASLTLKVPFPVWHFSAPVTLALRYRALPLKQLLTREHCVGSLARIMPDEELYKGVLTLYEVNAIQQSPTYVDLCHLWWTVAKGAHLWLLLRLWDRQECEPFDAYQVRRRRQSLLTWRGGWCGKTALDAVKGEHDNARTKIEAWVGANGSNPNANEYNRQMAKAFAKYMPTVTWLVKQRELFLDDYGRHPDAPYLPEDMWMDDESSEEEPEP